MDKHILQSIIEEAGFTCRSYSGRCMYGKKCLGVEVNGPFGEFFSNLVEPIADLARGDGIRAYRDVEDVAEGIRSMATDNMGLDMIVYFKEVPFFDEDHDEEELEEGASA
jgi:hypothetical protein